MCGRLCERVTPRSLSKQRSGLGLHWSTAIIATATSPYLPASPIGPPLMRRIWRTLIQQTMSRPSLKRVFPGHGTDVANLYGRGRSRIHDRFGRSILGLERGRACDRHRDDHSPKDAPRLGRTGLRPLVCTDTFSVLPPGKASPHTTSPTPRRSAATASFTTCSTIAAAGFTSVIRSTPSPDQSTRCDKSSSPTAS